MKNRKIGVVGAVEKTIRAVIGVGYGVEKSTANKTPMVTTMFLKKRKSLGGVLLLQASYLFWS